MFLRIASTPAVVAAAPKPLTGGPVSSSASAAGLGFVPRLARSPGGSPVLQIPVPRFIFQFPRGMGQVSISPSTPNLPSGCTPVGNNLCSTALYGPTPCNEVRECDPVTGAVHFQYSMPGASVTPNADILTVNPQTGVVQSYNGPTGAQSSVSPVPIGTQIMNPVTGAVTNPYNVAPVGPAAPVAPIANAPPAGIQTPTASVPIDTYVTQGLPTLPPATSTTTTAATANPLSFLEDTVSLFGVSIPVWMLGLGAIAAVWAISAGGKK